MADKILTFNGKTISGPSGTGMAIVRGPATMTIRFKFINNVSANPYSPLNEQWVKGTWTFIESRSDQYSDYSIWDWTYTGANVSKAFYNKFNDDTDWRLAYTEILNLTCTSEITDVSNLFNGCTKMIGSPYNIYTTLSSMNIRHTDCFKNWPLNKSSVAQDMVSIPEDWGGLKPLIGKGIKIGNSVWDNASIGLVSIPDIVEIEPDQMFDPGTIGYMIYDGITYYTVEAFKYLIAHQELLPSGWHIPTQEEAIDFYNNIQHNSKPVFNTTGPNGFNVQTTMPEEAGGNIKYGCDGTLEFIDGEWGLAWYDDGFQHDGIEYAAIDAYISFEACYGTLYLNTPSQQFPDPYEYIEDNMIPVRLVRD